MKIRDMREEDIENFRGCEARIWETLRKHLPEEVSRHGSKCHMHHPGQEYIMEGLSYPEGLCTWAYTDIYRDLVHLAWEGDFPWISAPGITFSSCTDGQKPVIFRLERIE